MAYTTINKSTDYFNTKIYTGAGGTQNITGVGFQPDFTWIKERGASNNHELFDVVRGVTKRIYSDLNNAEDTSATSLTAFGADGFTLGGAGGTNNNSDTYASWNWKGGGSGSANSDGTISSTVSANTTAGFSIVSYTGTSANATVGHGLGSAPAMIIIKARENVSSEAQHWIVYHQSLGNTSYQWLNRNLATGSSSLAWQDTSPTSSVFSLGNWTPQNSTGVDYIAYCFAEKTGYSKFGSYSGNGNTNGTFVYTGFKPSFFIMKRTDTTGNWGLFDNKRSSSGGSNVINYWVNPDLSNAEGSSSTAMNIDFVSNGVKIREDNGDLNASGGTYIYMAFGQSIVGSNNVPATAR